MGRSSLSGLNALFEGLRPNGPRGCREWTLSRSARKFNYSCLERRRIIGDESGGRSTGKAAFARGAVATVLLLVLASAAMAGIEGCEKIKDPDAYNSCLASFGPSVGAHKFTAEPGAERPAPQPGRRAGAKPRPGARHEPRRRANGRVRIEIFPTR